MQWRRIKAGRQTQVSWAPDIALSVLPPASLLLSAQAGGETEHYHGRGAPEIRVGHGRCIYEEVDFALKVQQGRLWEASACRQHSDMVMGLQHL